MSSENRGVFTNDFTMSAGMNDAKTVPGVVPAAVRDEEDVRRRVAEAVAIAAAIDEKEQANGWDEDDGLSELSTVVNAPEMIRLGGDPPTRSEEGSGVGMNWSVRESVRGSDDESVAGTEDERGMSPAGRSVAGRSEYWGGSSAGTMMEEDSAEAETGSEEESVGPGVQIMLPGTAFNEPREVVVRKLPKIKVPNSHNYVKYYDLGLQLQTVAEPRAHVFAKLRQVLELIFEADDTAAFYVVNHKDREEDRMAITIHNYQTWLEKPKLPFWRKYFFRIGPRLREGCCKVFFLMGHDIPFKDIKADCVAAWGRKTWWYEKALQYWNTVEVGWAFRSHEHIDVSDLAKELERWCGFPVGLCYKGVLPYDKTYRHQAMHFDVMEEEAEHDRMELCSLYLAGKKWEDGGDWPMRMNLRFVPTMDKANPDAEATVVEMRSRQRMFSEGVSHWMSTDFLKMDEMIESLGCTLRDYIMTIRSITRPALRLFLGVNRNRESAQLGYWITALPQVHMEAFTVMHGLLPFMRYHEQPADPAEFDGLFHPKVVDRARREVWDEERGGTVSYVSSQLAKMVREPDADLDEWMGPALAEQEAVRKAALEQLAAAGRPKRRAEDGTEIPDDLHSVGGDSSVGMVELVPLLRGRKARKIRDVSERREDEHRVQFYPKVQQKIIPGIVRRIVPAMLDDEEGGPRKGQINNRAHYATGGLAPLARPPPAPDEVEGREEDQHTVSS
jgi:hypothetical protein